MAEVRKFKPGQSAIAEAIQKAMGEGVRPVTPGGSPDPSKADAAPSAPAAPPATALTASTFLVTDFLFTPAESPSEQADDEGPTPSR